MGLIGYKYLYGAGIPSNLPNAIRLFELAANQDSAEAQYQLALHYTNGHGVQQNSDLAMQLYHQSAAHGFEMAHATIKSMNAYHFRNGFN